MATNDPSREEPKELYPEWTTRPHAVRGAPRTVERREPPRLPRQREPRNLMPLVGAFVVAAGVLAAIAFLYLERRNRRPLEESAGTPSYDADLQVAASRRIAREKDLRDLTLHIQVREQVIEVSGQVHDDRTRERVLNVLRMTPGAKGVIDHLQVGTPRTVEEAPERRGPAGTER